MLIPHRTFLGLFMVGNYRLYKYTVPWLFSSQYLVQFITSIVCYPFPTWYWTFTSKMSVLCTQSKHRTRAVTQQVNGFEGILARCQLILPVQYIWWVDLNPCLFRRGPVSPKDLVQHTPVMLIFNNFVMDTFLIRSPGQNWDHITGSIPHSSC